MTLTRDFCRAELEKANINARTLTEDDVLLLRKCLKRVFKNTKYTLDRRTKRPFFTMSCQDQWDGRECISFNDDMVGFAGWASDSNVRYILIAVLRFLAIRKAGYTPQARVEKINQFIETIASCGRKFFTHNGVVSHLELSDHGRIYFHDYYTHKRIYTHRKYCRWKGFTSGGTLKSLIEALRDFALKGHVLRAEYFYHGQEHHHVWGYDNDAMKIVHDKAIELGIAVSIPDN